MNLNHPGSCKICKWLTVSIAWRPQRRDSRTSLFFLLLVVEEVYGVIFEVSALVIVLDDHPDVFVSGHDPWQRFKRIGPCHSGTQFRAKARKRNHATTYLNLNTYQMGIWRMRFRSIRPPFESAPIDSNRSLRACVDKFRKSSAYENPSEATARNVNFVVMGRSGPPRPASR